jgi:hypothetical protein
LKNLNDSIKKILLNIKYDSKKNLSENKKDIFFESEESFTNSYDINNKPIAFKGIVVSTVKNSLVFQYPPTSNGEKHLLYLSGLNDLNMSEREKTQYFSPLPGMKNDVFDVSYSNGKKNWELYVKNWVTDVQKDLFSWINVNAPYIIKSGGKDYYLNLQCLHTRSGDRWIGNMSSGACTKKEDLRGGGYFDNSENQLHVIKKHHEPEEKKLSKDFDEFVITANKPSSTNKTNSKDSGLGDEQKGDLKKPKIDLKFKIGKDSEVIDVNK